MFDFTDEELIRYEKQILIADIGIKGQQKLKNASVAIVGLGGLGSYVATHLTSAGFGSLTLIDYDNVQLSNLNRQILHWEDDIGKSKVESAIYKLKKLNKNVNLVGINRKLDKSNICEVLKDVQVIADCTDNFEIRFLLNEYAIKHKKPLFHGAVYGFDGRATTIIPDETPCLKCIYASEMQENTVPVIGVAPGIIGSVQANEIIRYFLGLNISLKNKLLVYCCENLCYTIVKIRKKSKCSVCGKVR